MSLGISLVMCLCIEVVYFVVFFMYVLYAFFLPFVICLAHYFIVR